MKIPTSLNSIIGSIIVLTGILFSSSAYAVYPCVDITKEVSADNGLTWHDANTEAEAVLINADALYKMTIKRCDYDGLLDINVTDELLGVNLVLNNYLWAESSWYLDVELDVWVIDFDAEAQTIIVPAPGICKDQSETIKNTASVTANAEYRSYQVFDTDDAWIRCEPASQGGEGCTPGYWKQPHHFDSWPAELTPDMSYSSVFGRVIEIRTKDAGNVTDPTLLQALSALGGKVNTAARHSTAAYINATSANVSYDLDQGLVIENLQNSVDNNDFGVLIEALVNFNEQNCPLN